jgi:hypothetical protein
MRRFALAIAILVASGFAQAPQQFPPQQPQSQQPWSEQMPGPQAGPGPNYNPNSNPDDDGSAPDRGVARVSYMNGNVSVRRGDSGELVAAIVNAPLVAGDRIVTAETGRAEVQFDALNLIRLGPATEVRLSELAYHRYQVQIATGTTIFRIVRDSDAQVEISTPSVAVRPTRAGVYRVSVLPDGTSQITVRIGEAEVFSPRGSEPLRQGQTMVARGSASDPEFQLSNTPGDDEFERWCVSRDRLLERSTSSRYIPRDVAGTEDMEGNGRWVNDGSYGNVWTPNISAADPDWAPYSCGRWVWLDYYGWSWVGCESWGWAPYHYGRWYHASFGWAWWPGVTFGRPYYWRPALVGFFGWGGGGGFGFDFGNLGWCPLAPFEVYRPWYGRGFYGGYRGGNFVNVNVYSSFRNARFNHAVTSVRAGDFGRGGIGRENIVRAHESDLSRAGAVHGQLPMTPSRESTRFSNREASTQGLPRTSDNTRFASHMQTSQPNRMSFEQQRQGMSQGMSRSSMGSNGPSSNGPSNFTGGANNAGSNGGRFNGAQRSGAGPRSNGVSNGVSGGGQSNGGWQRFDPSTNRGAGGMRQSSPQSFQQSAPQPLHQMNQPMNGGNRGGFQGNPSGNSSGPQSSPRTFSQPQGQGQGQGRPNYTPPPQPRNYTPPQPRSFSPQQPVHINPPIVQNRGGSPGGNSGGNSGGSRPSGGGGGGARPSGNSGGGGSHGNSGGGGHGRH